MSSVIHIAEVAAILTAAYVLGWTLGYGAHRLMARAPRGAAVPAERIAAATGSPPADALVKAPVIDPVPSAPPPAMPPTPAADVETAPVPAPAAPPNSATVAPLEATAMPATDPAVAPLAPVEIPVVAVPTPLRIEPVPPVGRPSTAPPPEPEPEPEVLLTATPALKAGEAWSGKIRGRAASTPAEPELADEPAALVAGAPGDSAATQLDVPLTIDLGPVGPDTTYGEPVLPEELVETPESPPSAPIVEDEPTPAVDEREVEDEVGGAVSHSATTHLDVPLTIDLGLVGPDATYGEPVLPEPLVVTPESLAPAPIVEDKATPAVAVDPEPASVDEPVPVDEDAAMRAIEGGWSRVGATALPGAPELSDVGAAVAAAQTAVEQVLARAGIDAEASSHAARPKGLPRPRHGRKDDLKQINGLGALDESTLNNLGVFHFDQIAGWTDAQVLWMENHVFARGRIGAEDWQQQARHLIPSVGD